MLDLNGSGAPKKPADGYVWICRAGTTGHWGRFRPGTSLLGAVRRWSPGLFYLRSAGRLAAYLENVGLCSFRAAYSYVPVAALLCKCCTAAIET